MTAKYSMLSSWTDGDRGKLRPLLASPQDLSRTMVALPMVLLLIGSGLAVIPARRMRRFRWAIALGAALAAWIATIGLARQVPDDVSLSIWRPEGLFGDRIALSLDVSGWTVGFGVLTSIVAALLHGPRAEPPGGVPFVGLLGFGAIGLAAVQAGNLLTTALTWTLLDVLGLALLVRAFGVAALGEPQWRGRALTGIAGILVAISAVIGLDGEAMGSDLDVVGAHPLAAALFTVGLAIRVAGSAWPVHDVAGEGNGEAAWSVVALAPLAACASALARARMSPEGPVAWLMIALGAVALLTGCFRWTPRGRIEAARTLPFVGVGVMGAAALGSSADPDAAAVIWSAAGGVILLAGTWCSIAGPSTWAGRASAVLGALVVAGLPFSLGAWLVAPFLAGDAGVGSWVMGGLVGLGLAALGSGIWELTTDGEAAESKPRPGGFGAWAAWLLLTMAAFAGYGFLASQAGGALQIGSLATLGLLIAGVVVRRRWRPRGIERLSRVAMWLDPRLVVRAAARAAEVGLTAARGVADLVEGEAAMLWIYVILVALGAAAAASR